MISLRFCIEKDCHGTLRAVQTGGYHNDTKVSKIKCNKCGKLFCTIQFIAPIELMKYARVEDAGGKKISTTPRLRHPVKVDLDPRLKQEIRVHDGAMSDPWLA